MENPERIKIEVAYARPDVQVIVPLELHAGCTVSEAIRHSGLLERFPELDPATQKFGVFGKLVKADQVLRTGDRVEIYRPLIADPKAVRKQRAAEGKVMKKGAAALNAPEGGGGED